jgi:polysaccharide pyruvyl transferase CsaB
MEHGIERVAKMATNIKKIVISGYYGFDNSGDEAVLQSILLALQDSGQRYGVKFEPTVLSANPQKTTEQYGVRAVARSNIKQILRTLRSADGLISGGGSLLQDVTGLGSIPYYLGIIKLSQWLEKPVFVYAQGIGPVRRVFFQWLIRSVFQKNAYISVRDIESKKFLEHLELGAKTPIQLVPDPVMALPLPEDVKDEPNEHVHGQSIIGVSVRFWQDNEKFLTELGKALQQLLDSDTTICVHLLPFHLPTDEHASLKLIKEIKAIHHNRIHMKAYHEPQQMLAAVGRCRLLIGMRLHALIYAANQHVPMVGISYDPKIDQFLARLDMKAVATTTNLTAAEIVRTATHLLEEQSKWKSDKQDLLSTLRAEARFPAEAIALYFAPSERNPDE